MYHPYMDSATGSYEFLLGCKTWMLRIFWFQKRKAHKACIGLPYYDSYDPHLQRCTDNELIHILAYRYSCKRSVGSLGSVRISYAPLGIGENETLVKKADSYHEACPSIGIHIAPFIFFWLAT